MDGKHNDVRVDGELVRYDLAPECAREILRRWIEAGIHPCQGYKMILCMDLMAVTYVDVETLAALPAIVRWLRNHAPSRCYGSRAAMELWEKEHQRA